MLLTDFQCQYMEYVATNKPTFEERKAAHAHAVPRLARDSLALSPFMLKSSLFSAVSQGPRVNFATYVELRAHPGYKVEFCGEELRQDDRMVLLALIKARSVGRTKLLSSLAIDLPIKFAPRRFCIKQLGWPDSSHSTKKLAACINRLKVARVRIYGERFGTHAFSLVSYAALSPREWKVRLSEDLATIFSRPVTYLKQSVVADLHGLDSWIYGYVSADRCDDDDGISRKHLRSLCGLTGYSQNEFNRRLKLALKKLQELAVITGFKSSGDRLDIDKPSKDDPEVFI